MQRHFGSKGIAQSATGGDPSRLEKAGRSRICLSFDGKHLKADCGFGLDDSRSSDAFLLRCSDAEVGQDRASGVDRVRLSVDGKHLKVDCGFGLDHSKSSDALLLRCSDAEVGQDRDSGVD